MQPKILTSDVVITMGCGAACPCFPGVSCRNWVLDNPAGKDIEAVRPIRDEIRAHAELLIAELLLAHNLIDGAEPAAARSSGSEPLPWAPVDLCTLPTAEQPLREAELEALFATALTSIERVSPRTPA